MRFRSGAGRQPRRLVVRRARPARNRRRLRSDRRRHLRPRRDQDPRREAGGGVGARTACRRLPACLAQRSLTLPATPASQAPAADRGLRPAVDLALRVPGRDLLLLRARGAGRYDRDPQALLDRRRPPLVGAGAERQVRRDAGREQPDLVPGRSDRRPDARVVLHADR